MKNLICSLVLIFSIVFQMNAQKTYSLKSIQTSFGKGTLTSGADLNLDFSQKDNILFLKGNDDRAIVNIGKTFVSGNGEFKMIGSLGVFKNVPWFGPMLIYNNSGFTFLSWNGLGLGKDKILSGPGFTPKFFFSYQGLTYRYKKNSLGYAFMLFTTQKINHYLIYSRDFQINDSNKFFFETTYDYNNDLPLFIIGYKRTLRK